MASSTETLVKALCTTCGKGKGTFRCEGCLQTFCSKHSTEHRHALGKELEEIECMRDLMHQTLVQQTKDPTQHSLIRKIDQWERESIDKIRQAAEEARQTLLKSIIQNTATVEQKLEPLTKELQQSREEDDFDEMNLRQWIEKLEVLKNEFENPANITVQEHPAPFVRKICVNCGDTSNMFQNICGYDQVEESGRLIVVTNEEYNEFDVDHIAVRGKDEYTTGRHVFRFRIEKLPDNGWIFFGIVSKSTCMQTNSFSSSSIYGWSNRNQVYVAGKCREEQTSDATNNDTMMLILDCDRRWIQLTNERTKRNLELSININKCPFPWQFHLNVENVSTAIRILSISE